MTVSLDRYGEMFNLIKDIEGLAITSDSDAELEFLSSICDAIEAYYEIEDFRLGLA